MNKKTISPVVATALLLVVAVVAVVGFQTWFGTYSSDLFVKAEQNSKETSQTNIETLVGDQLYFKNTLNENISITQIKIGNKECNISLEIESGIQNISLGDCVNNLTSSINDIVVITDKQIYTKKHLFKDVKIVNHQSLNYVWNTTSWSSCSEICGGGNQTRIVWCEQNDGLVVSDDFCSDLKPPINQICNVNPCDACDTLTNFTDVRDNEIYQIAELIDGNCWFTQNLRFDVGKSPCLNNDCITNGLVCGRYYPTSHPPICPIGWHLPTSIEINNILSLFGDYSAFEVGFYDNNCGNWGPTDSGSGCWDMSIWDDFNLYYRFPGLQDFYRGDLEYIYTIMTSNSIYVSNVSCNGDFGYVARCIKD